jgi:hypothetical protein
MLGEKPGNLAVRLSQGRGHQPRGWIVIAPRLK